MARRRRYRLKSPRLLRISRVYLLCLLSVLSGLQMRPTAAFARLRCIRERMTTMRQSMMQQQTLVWTSSSNLPCVRGQNEPDVVPR